MAMYLATSSLFCLISGVSGIHIHSEVATKRSKSAEESGCHPVKNARTEVKSIIKKKSSWSAREEKPRREHVHSVSFTDLPPWPKHVEHTQSVPTMYPTVQDTLTIKQDHDEAKRARAAKQTFTSSADLLRRPGQASEQDHDEAKRARAAKQTFTSSADLLRRPGQASAGQRSALTRRNSSRMKFDAMTVDGQPAAVILPRARRSSARRAQSRPDETPPCCLMSATLLGLCNFSWFGVNPSEDKSNKSNPENGFLSMTSPNSDE